MKIEDVEGIGPAYAAKLTATLPGDVRRIPSESVVQDWIDQAKSLPRVVEH